MAVQVTVMLLPVLSTETSVIHADSVLLAGASAGTRYDTDATGAAEGTLTPLDVPVPAVPSGRRTPSSQLPVKGTPPPLRRRPWHR